MSKQVEKKEPTDVAVPQARGFEEPIDRSDLLIPRCKKLEALSPELDGSDLKAGQLINSVTQEVLPETFVPIFFYKSWIRFNPRSKDAPGFDSNFGLGDTIYRTNDPKDPRLVNDAIWHGDTPPLATAFLNFFSLFEGQDMPIIVSFCNTSYKAGKQLLSLCKFAGGDMFARKYKLTTKKVQNDKGSYYVMNIALAGLNDDTTQAENFYNTFATKARDLEVHEENTDQVPF